MGDHMTAEDPPLACTLAGDEFRESLAWIAALARDALRSYDREDLVLEQMERGEEMHRRLSPLEAEEAEARQRLATLEEGSARELVEVERALEERRAERAALASAIDPDLLALYEELRRQKRGVGAAALVDGVCQACHQKLSPMYLDRLKRAGGVRRCEYCRRILVF